MAETNLSTSGGGGNLEQAKIFLTNNLTLSEHSCLTETLEHIDKLDSPFPVKDLALAAAELHEVDERFLYICQRMREDPELARATKALWDKVQELEESEPGAGKELVVTIRELARLEREAKQ